MLPRLLGKPLHVGDNELTASSVIGDPGWIPSDGNQPDELRLTLVARIPFDHRDSVLGPVADKQPLAVGRESKRARLGPEQFRRSRLRPHRLHDHGARHVEDRDGVGPGVGTHDMPPIGADGQSRRMLTDNNLGGSPGGEIDDAHAPLAGHMPNRIDPNRRPLAGRADKVVGTGTTPSPIADERLPVGQDDVEGRHADVDRSQQLAGDGIDLEESVGKIAADVEATAIDRKGQSGGDLVFPLGDAGRWQRDRVGRGHDTVVHGEHLHRSVNVAHVESPAVGSETETGKTLDRLLVGLQVPFGAGGLGTLHRRWLDALDHGTGGGIDDDDLVGLPGGDGQLPVGREGDRLGTEAGKFDLPAHRGEHLIDRRDRPPFCAATDRLGRRPGGLFRRGVVACQNGEEEDRGENDRQGCVGFHGAENTAPEPWSDTRHRATLTPHDTVLRPLHPSSGAPSPPRLDAP